VMDEGKVISSGRPTEVRNDPKVIEAYLGHRRTEKAVETAQ
jgi:branched-chain amino acid transport system ATP-binding protein